jgi:hypothetical protein
MGTVRIGCDLGQKTDPTAIVVIEIEKRADLKEHFVARHVERMPLGTPYPAVVDRLVVIHWKLVADHEQAPIWVDATGLGAPVVDLLREARLPVTPVYLTGTDKAVREGSELHLGKAVLVSRLQVLLQSGQIHLPKTAEAQALIDELLSYEIRVTDAGHAQFGAFKTGAHDDLVTALGLAVWQPPYVSFADIGHVPDIATPWAYLAHLGEGPTTEELRNVRGPQPRDGFFSRRGSGEFRWSID